MASALISQKHSSEASIKQFKSDVITGLKELKAPREEIIIIKPAMGHSEF